VGVAIIGLSMSPASALKYPHHASARHPKKPAISTATANVSSQTTWPFGGVSNADKEMYKRYKRGSGLK
jgi:hypothetical protein